MSKAMKGIGVIQKLSKTLPRHSLITIYKSFVRPYLDYGDIIYDLPNNECFTQKIERIQYNATIAITGAIKGTSQSKLYSGLGFESLKFRRWFRKLCTFLSLKQVVYQNACWILFHKPIICTMLGFWKMLQHFTAELMVSSTLFPSTILEWNKLDRKIGQSSTLLTFRNSLLKIGGQYTEPNGFK